MRRSVKVVIAAGVGLVVAGTVVTATAVTGGTSTSPYTLCVTKIIGTVTAPSAGGKCKSNQTAISVGNAADVSDLASRMASAERNQAADETTIAQQSTTITNLQSQLAGDEANLDRLFPATVASYANPANPGVTFQVQFVGQNLKPGVGMTIHYTDNGRAITAQFTEPGSDGIYRFFGTYPCSVHDITVTGTATFGSTVTATPIQTGPGC